MKFALKDIQPNPFRKVDRYPILRKKVDALKASIESTDFWDNIVARKVGGKAEIAYGHHRLTALREIYKPSHEVNLIVRDLDDSLMVRMMANENLEEYGTSIQIEHETIRTVVEGYAAGKFALPKVAAKSSTNQIRIAPSFKQGCAGDIAGASYTAETLAEFLGGTWTADRVRRALQALELIEKGVLKDSTFNGLNAEQAIAVVRTARAQIDEHTAAAKQAEREKEAARTRAEKAKDPESRRVALAAEKKAQQQYDRIQSQAGNSAAAAGNSVARALRDGEVTPKSAWKVAAKTAPKDKKATYVDPAVQRVAKQLDDLFEKGPIAEALRDIADAIKHGATVDRLNIQALRHSATKAVQRLNSLITEITKPARSNGSNHKQLESHS